jgi:hypothetical protein
MTLRDHKIVPSAKPPAQRAPMLVAHRRVRHESVGFNGQFPSLWQTGISGPAFMDWVMRQGSPQWRYYRGIGIGNKMLRFSIGVYRWMKNHPKTMLFLFGMFVVLYTIYRMEYEFVRDNPWVKEWQGK